MLSLREDIALRVAQTKALYPVEPQEPRRLKRDDPELMAKRSMVGNQKRLERMAAAIAKEDHQQWEWWRLFMFYGKQCCRCGHRKTIAKDHIQPVSKGGSNGLGNLQPLCRSCNAKKYDRWEDHRWDSGEWIETVRMGWLVGE